MKYTTAVYEECDGEEKYGNEDAEYDADGYCR
jgi:hypothetical protein